MVLLCSSHWRIATSRRVATLLATSRALASQNFHSPNRARPVHYVAPSSLSPSQPAVGYFHGYLSPVDASNPSPLRSSVGGRPSAQRGDRRTNPKVATFPARCHLQRAGPLDRRTISYIAHWAGPHPQRTSSGPGARGSQPARRGLYRRTACWLGYSEDGVDLGADQERQIPDGHRSLRFDAAALNGYRPGAHAPSSPRPGRQVFQIGAHSPTNKTSQQQCGYDYFGISMFPVLQANV